MIRETETPLTSLETECLIYPGLQTYMLQVQLAAHKGGLASNTNRQNWTKQKQLHPLCLSEDERFARLNFITFYL